MFPASNSGAVVCAFRLLLSTPVACLVATASPWPNSLSLANGGCWSQRLCLTVSNTTDQAISGEALCLALPGLAGTPVASLRACRADGVELLHELLDPRGNARRSGELRADDQWILPVECPPHSTASLWIYAGNTNAWPVPDFLPAKFTGHAEPAVGGRFQVSVGEVESLHLEPAGPIKPKSGPTWRHWAEVRVRSFATTPRRALVRVNLRWALTLLPGLAVPVPVKAATADGMDLETFQLGRGADLLFGAGLAPRSEARFQIGFGSGAEWEDGAVLRDYSRLLAGTLNLARNGSFEQGDSGADPAGWLAPAPDGTGGRGAGFSDDARFGSRSLELTVPTNGNHEWLGWRSREIPVKPGATYLLSGWLRSIDLQGSATIHAHFHNAQGGLTRSGAMVSTQPNVSGTCDWMNSSGFLEAPPDAATIQVHLTLNTEGTLRHDGIVLCEVVDGGVVSAHSPAERTPTPRLAVWEVNPLVKVFPDTPPQEPAQAVSVELARNESEVFQLALRSGERGPASVNLTVSPLRNAGGNELPALKIERVGYVPVDHPSAYYQTDVPEWCRKVPRGAGATDGWAGWWPDPLVPGSRVDLKPGQTQAVWFTVDAPAATVPGQYQAELSLGPGSGTSLSLPLNVRVLPFTLPKPGHLRAIFDLRFGPGGGFGNGIESREDRRQWLRFMAEHRLGINEIQPAPKFSYRDGRVSMDPTEFDETARYCFDELGMNVAYTPHFFYLFGWAYPPKKLFGLEPWTPEWTDAFQQSYRLFADHLREMGWADRFVYYISDEPHFQHPFVVEQMQKLCALIHEVDKTIPIYSSTWRHCAAWDDSLDLWGIGQYGCFPTDDMQRLQRAGKQMWFTCDGQMATDTPFLATERLLPYYCFKYRAGGFEFWGLAWWTYNPWEVGWHRFIRQSNEGKDYYWVRYPDGDGYLAYPGKPVGLEGPVSTIRLEQIREGLEDYEALFLLADRVAEMKRAGRMALDDAERALSMARALVTIPNAGGLRSTEILPDPDRIPAVRKAVNAALVRLLHDRSDR